MLDIRAVAYIAPVSEVDFAPVPLTVRLVNYADETGLVSAGFRIYNDSTGLLIYQSDIIPVEIAKGETVDVSALTDFMPPAPADDTYFVLFDGNAANALVPDGIILHLGSWYFDVKPAPLGPIPAGHAVTHEDTGIDEVDVTDLSGLLADPQTPILHSGTHALPSPDAVYADFLATLENSTYFRLSPDGAGGVKWNSDVEKHHTNHEEGGADELEAADLKTAEMDDTLVLAPDGAGGVEFAPLPDDHGLLTGLADDDHPQYRLRHEITVETDFLINVGGTHNPWYSSAIASGSAANITGLLLHPGIYRLSSSTSANSGFAIQTQTYALLLSGGETARCWHRPLTLAGTTRHHGFHDSNSVSDPVDGAWIWQDPATGIIYGRTRNNSVGSTTGTGYQLVTNTWYLEKIVVNANASQVDFYLYDNAGALLWTDNLTTNIPTAAGRELGHAVVTTNSGTTAVALDDVDFLCLTIPDLRPNL